MKVLELCMSKGFGGLELYVLKAANYLNKHKFNIQALTWRDSFLSQKMASHDIPQINFSFSFHYLPVISAFRLSRYMHNQEIDILHVHWGKDLLLAVLAKVVCRRKIRLVFTRQMALTRYKNDVYHSFLYRNIDAYLVITKVLYDEALKYLPIKKENVHLLYYGVPASSGDIKNCDSYLNENNIRMDQFRLAIFGRIEKGKGQHLVIDAANKLIMKGIKLQVTIIGHIMDKHYFNELEKTIKQNNLEDNIFYLGFHNSPTSIMACFDAVVLATKCETFGLVLPEAMRAGTAVIGSNCGGVPEIIEHEKTGLLFEPESVQDLTSQLEKLITNEEFCNRLAKAGKLDADERFSEEKHFKKLISHFQSS